MRLKNQIELLNSEGPILTAKRFGPAGKSPAKFEVVVEKSGAKWTLDMDNFMKFVNGQISLIENLSDKNSTKEWKYMDYSVDMKPPTSSLDLFLNHEEVSIP
jgi:hypothetical protein